MIVIYILLLVIAVFTVMSFFSLKKLKNQTALNPILADEKYFELKYKLQFITSVGVVIIGVCGFLGYDKLDKFVDKFQNKTDSLDVKLKEYDEKIYSIDAIIRNYDSKITAYNRFIKKIDISKNQISNNMLNSNKQLASLIDTIDIIKKRNILDKSFYVIDNLIKKNDTVIEKYYFKDLTTIIGDRLPNFNKKPVLFIIPQSGAQLVTKTVTSEYIEVGFSSYTSWEKDDPKNFAFGLLIAKRAQE